MQRKQDSDGWYKSERESAGCFVKLLMCLFGALVGGAIGGFFAMLGVRYTGDSEGTSLVNPLTITMAIGAGIGFVYTLFAVVAGPTNPEDERFDDY